MFASVLREITGYFDRRALVSTFFPVLVFLGAIVIVMWTTASGVAGAVAEWSRVSAVVQALLLVGFLAVVTFLTFLLGNLREWLDRISQGHWPSWADRFGAPLVQRHNAARQTLIDRDNLLRKREEELVGERYALPRPETVVPAPLPDTEIDTRLDDLATALTSGAWSPGTARKAAEIAGALRDEESARVMRFTDVLVLLDERLAVAEQQVRSERAKVQQELFVWYPQLPHGVLPTRLGNVVRAAEQHPSVRYRLDAVVLWTRLQPLLPKDFADSVRNAKVSVDLLLTMAVFLPLFGAPLSWWLAVRLPRVVSTPAAWLTYLAMVVCTATACVVLRRARDRLMALAVAGILLVVSFWSSTLRVEIGVLWTVALFVMAYGLYRNAVHAAVAYTERLRTAFDLYRWKLLEELRIALPTTLDEERLVWRDLTQFLYRGGTAEPTGFRYDHPAPVQVLIDWQNQRASIGDAREPSPKRHDGPPA
ncbi:hypothetical protein B0I31_10296 [Saccharothrix carnea]|uniref:Uncharacterized protein n=2 Tax=Saccharothrix carnea TaxID=1280637 RepID=A0A2P8IF64_SACCR|nr:hypothetical protein B0I31_10296 [Saccharothrix carnea]